MGLTEISILLASAAGIGIVARILKQPLLVGYLFAGALLTFFGVVKDQAALASMGRIGIALLLFLVGIEMNLRELPSLGKVALLTGIGQILFTSFFGFLIALFLGFGIVPAMYIAVALTFSSTIIIVKLLSEKGDLGSLYGKIAVGFLLVQDFVAVVILMFLSGIGKGGFGLGNFLIIGIKAIVLFVAVWFLSKKVLPSVFEKIVGTSSELLFITSIAWALGIAALIGGPLGFSFEIGGFLAGLALSNLPEHLGVAAKTRPLRDFFLTIFFLYLGTQLLISDFGAILTPAIIFSLFVLIGNPLIVLIIMGVMRYKKRSSFLASVTVAQISEFSFILMAVGASMGHLSQSHVAIVIVVGVITMTISTYLILYSEKIYLRLKNALGLFERENTQEQAFEKEISYSDHIVLVGCNRVGMTILPYLKKKKILTLVIDHNPKVFNTLTADNIPTLLGDIEDPDILDKTQLNKAQLVISSIPYLGDNLILLEYIRHLSRRPAVILKAQGKADAVKLYESGASYVIIPDVIAGEFLRHVFVSHGINEQRIKKMGKSHFKRLLS